MKEFTDCQDVAYCTQLFKQGQFAYPDPADWEAAHYIAIVQKMAVRPGGQWQLTFMQTGESVDLEP